MMEFTGYSPFNYYSHGKCTLVNIDFYENKGQYFYIFDIKLDDYNKILHYADYYNPIFANVNISDIIDCWALHQRSYGQSIQGDLYYQNTIKEAEYRPTKSLIIFIITFVVLMIFYILSFIIYAYHQNKKEIRNDLALH